MKKVIISVFVLFVCVAIPAQINKDSLWNIWNDSTKTDTIRYNALDYLAWHGYLYSNPDSALTLYKLNYKLSRKIKETKYKLLAIGGQATSLAILGDFEKAISFYQNSLEIMKENGIEDGLELVYNNMGAVYNKMGDYRSALFFYRKSLILKEQNNDTLSTVRTYYNISNIYNSLNEKENAIKTLDKSSRLIQLYNCKENYLYCKQIKAYISNLKGSIYSDEKKYDLAIDLLNKSLQLFQESNDQIGIILCYSKIGEIQLEKKEYLLAIQYFKKAYDLSDETNSDEMRSEALFLLANSFYKNGDKYKALINAKKSLIIAEQIGNKEVIEKASFLLYDIYQNEGRMDDALEMYKSYIKQRDTLQSEINKRALYEYEYKYDYEKKVLADSIYNVEENKLKQLQHESEIKEERTIRYGILGLLTLILSFSFLLYRRFRVTKRQNKIIKSQKKQVDKAYKELDVQNKKVEQKNKEVLASINYASKIQDTILPNTDEIKSCFKNLFVLYQPKDIVGGDFYWYRSFGEISVIATVDCTGHGVPGGFMSMMGSLLLDKIVDENRLNTGDILKELNNEIVRVLDQKSGGVIQDGMDIALCVFNTENRTLSFSGARNGIMILKNNQVRCFDAEIFSVGGSYSKKSQLLKRDFKTHSIELNKNDWVFMYTDGYYDQLGGKDITSMGMKLFQDNLMDSLSAEESKDVFLMKKFNSWKGDFPQIDDVLVLGFQV